MYSEICLSGGVSATRLGMMKGTLEEGLPSASSTKPAGSFSVMRKPSLPVASILSTKVSSAPPIESRLPQRSSEATTSSPVTGAPSWNCRPVRSVKS
jgi:hypothetical protein